MQIFVAPGRGRASTALAAFDAALAEAGMANYNLVVLSSVIPPGAEIVLAPFPGRSEEWGQRLYVVMAERRESTPGREAWAGVGWVQQPDGRGLFVEHVGPGREAVEVAIRTSLADMVERRPGPWGEVQLLTSGARCDDQPVCALVAAGYQAQPW